VAKAAVRGEFQIGQPQLFPKSFAPPSDRCASRATRTRQVRAEIAPADSAVVIASSIFLDIFNVFLPLTDLFGGRRE
jgi:hypothetical protein